MSTQVKKTISILMFATVCLVFGGIVNQRAEASVCFLPDDAMCDEEGVRSTRDYGFWPGGSGNGKTVSSCDSSYNSSRGGSNCKQCTDKTSRYYGYYKCGDDVNCDDYTSTESVNECGERCDKCMISGDKNYGKYKCPEDEDCDSCADYTDELPADYNDPNTCQAKVCEACPTDNTKYKCEDKTEVCDVNVYTVQPSYYNSLTTEQKETHCYGTCDLCYDELNGYGSCDRCLDYNIRAGDCDTGYQPYNECNGKGGTWYEGCCNTCNGYIYSSNKTGNGWSCTKCENACGEDEKWKCICTPVTCTAVTIPANAHGTTTCKTRNEACQEGEEVYTDWGCNSGYTKQGNGCVENNDKLFCINFNYRCGDKACSNAVINEMKVEVNGAYETFDDAQLNIVQQTPYKKYCYDYDKMLSDITSSNGDAHFEFPITYSGNNPKAKPDRVTYTDGETTVVLTGDDVVWHGEYGASEPDKFSVSSSDNTIEYFSGNYDVNNGKTVWHYASVFKMLSSDAEFDEQCINLPIGKIVYESLGYDLADAYPGDELPEQEICSIMNDNISKNIEILSENTSVNVTKDIDVKYANIPNGEKRCVYVHANCYHANELINYELNNEFSNGGISYTKYDRFNEFCVSRVSFKVKGSYNPKEINHSYELTRHNVENSEDYYDKTHLNSFTFVNCDIPDWDAGELEISSHSSVDYSKGDTGNPDESSYWGSSLNMGGYRFADKNGKMAGSRLVKKVGIGEAGVEEHVYVDLYPTIEFSGDVGFGITSGSYDTNYWSFDLCPQYLSDEPYISITSNRKIPFEASVNVKDYRLERIFKDPSPHGFGLLGSLTGGSYYTTSQLTIAQNEKEAKSQLTCNGGLSISRPWACDGVALNAPICAVNYTENPSYVNISSDEIKYNNKGAILDRLTDDNWIFTRNPANVFEQCYKYCTKSELKDNGDVECIEDSGTNYLYRVKEDSWGGSITIDPNRCN